MGNNGVKFWEHLSQYLLLTFVSSPRRVRRGLRCVTGPERASFFWRIANENQELYGGGDAQVKIARFGNLLRVIGFRIIKAIREMESSLLVSPFGIICAAVWMDDTRR